MINIIYCNSHKVLIGANHKCKEGFHTHIDEFGNNTIEQGILISDIDESNYNGLENFIAKDGTIINSASEWLVYLEKYIPIN
jgi:hypothetical protein